MSCAIRNLVELIEPKPMLFKVLERRATHLGDYKGLGPPDLCYLVKEDKGGIFRRGAINGYYHYVYGADAASPATIAAYIKCTLSKSEDE
jgi:hypothetical protein